MCHQALTRESEFRSSASQSDICDTEGHVFLSRYFVLPVSIITPVLNSRLHLHADFFRRTNGSGLGTFRKKYPLGIGLALEVTVGGGPCLDFQNVNIPLELKHKLNWTTKFIIADSS